MFSKQDFIDKYRNNSDLELAQMQQSLSNYSSEAQEALQIVIREKGGMEQIMERIQAQKKIDDEVRKVETEIAQLNNKHTDLAFMKKMIQSDILDHARLEQVIESAYQAAEKDREDQVIKPRTINGSIFGGLFGAVTGGILWGLMLMYSEKRFFFFIAGLVLYCFMWIRIATRQSGKNQVVIIATILASLIAIGIGVVIFNVYGYRGPVPLYH